jgi:hypothetical protein
MGDEAAECLHRHLVTVTEEDARVAAASGIVAFWRPDGGLIAFTNVPTE